MRNSALFLAVALGPICCASSPVPGPDVSVPQEALLGTFEVCVLPGACDCLYISPQRTTLEWGTGDLADGAPIKGTWQPANPGCILLKEESSMSRPDPHPAQLCIENADVALVVASQKTWLERVLADRSIGGRCAVLP